jgi:alkanesulfonate monooxygenase SsuD/methylene tetrahydromethanopterin reductase-like flavin-dependent oxidoreductase (luciferase family)
MRYGVSLPPFGDFADPGALAQLAREAESAGWDGFFIWDHIVFDPSWHPMADPWVGLAAAAISTQRIRLGTLLTPLPRRRPWKLARETVSVDRLAGGRLTLGVGIGDPVQWEFGFFGEPTDAKLRAGMLDEGLEVLTGLWGGEMFSYQGQHYQLQEMKFLPRPVQQPRIPIWVGGWWPNKPPMRRAARWDGVCPGRVNFETLTPDDWRDLLAYIGRHRDTDAPFDAVHTGTTGADPARDAETVAGYAAAGVTWWIEDISPYRFGQGWEDQWMPGVTELIRERVRKGPPGGR